MSDAYAIFVNGIDFGMVDSLSPKIAAAASKAINSTAAMGRTMAADFIGREIHLPASYIKSGDRLTVSARATPDHLSATLRASDSPISLARFQTGPAVRAKKGETGGGIPLEIKSGHPIFMKGAFLVKLRRGNASISADTFNVGLAVRTRPGERPSAAYRPKDLGNGLWLLYGPSIDQVFKGEASSDRGVRDKIAPILGATLQAEFDRLIQVDFS